MIKKINLLLCDTFPGLLPESIPSHESMFFDLFRPINPDLTFDICRVLEGELPEQLETDTLYLIPGSNNAAYDDLPWIFTLQDWIRKAAVPKARNLNNPTRNEVPCGESGHPVQTGVPKVRNKNQKPKYSPKTMSYTSSYYHVVFRTYRSEQTIPVEHERELYAYMFGIARNLRCTTLRIGGMPDHVHLFVSLPPTLSIASFVQRVKTDSSKWLKANPNFPRFQGWAREYAGISKSSCEKDTIVNYIMRQKEHHKRFTFEEEYRALLEENGIVIDERYFLRND